jgi:hypothetical protein
MQRHQLQRLSREELIREAEGAGVPRPRVLTTAELIDEILKRTATSDRERTRSRGWLGRARDLLATVVEKGLHLPDAAAAIRSGPKGWPPPPPPLPTVTLAEIYAAQGHLERAVGVLDEVLKREPDHQEARELRERFLAQLARGPKGASEPPKGASEEAEAGAEEEGESAAEEPRAAEPKAEELAGDAEPAAMAAPAAITETAPVAAEPVAAEKRAPVLEEAASARPAAVDAPASAVEPADAEESAAAEAAKPEAALPQRYDVDEVVALAVDPSTFYVYWEVRPTTFAHRMASSPGGSLALRVVAITPGWDGPIVETRDIHIDALFGDRFIHHVRPRADVRVSVGWLDQDRFDPIAVGAEVSAPRAFVAAGASSTPGAPLDLSEGLHGARSGAARAVELFARSPRAAERIAAGWRPRELQGAAMAGAAGGVSEWIWVPGPETAPDAEATSLPFTFGPVAGVDRAGSGEGPSAAARWGGASEGAPRWGGASEGAPRWGGASEHALR